MEIVADCIEKPFVLKWNSSNNTFMKHTQAKLFQEERCLKKMKTKLLFISTYQITLIPRFKMQYSHCAGLQNSLLFLQFNPSNKITVIYL